MTDRELLELAAKAADIGEYIGMCADAYQVPAAWNPLTDDGDALWLAVKLEMQIYTGFRRIEAEICSDSDEPAINCSEPKEGDPYAATRRAIVRAAAEIGKTL